MGVQLSAAYLPNTILYIRDYLIEHGEGNPYAVFKYARDRAVEDVRSRALPREPEQVVENRVRTVYKAVNYRSIIRYFYILRELGLIEYVRSEPSGRGQPKNFYAIVPNKTDLFQGGIQYQVYPWTYYGGARYDAMEKRMPVPKGRWEEIRYPPKRTPPTHT